MIVRCEQHDMKSHDVFSSVLDVALKYPPKARYFRLNPLLLLLPLPGCVEADAFNVLCVCVCVRLVYAPVCVCVSERVSERVCVCV